jgi:hypothetical protein
VYANLVAPGNPDPCRVIELRVRDWVQDGVQHTCGPFLTRVADAWPILTVLAYSRFEGGMHDQNDASDDRIVEIEEPVDHGLPPNLHEKLRRRGVESGPQAGRWNDEYR